MVEVAGGILLALLVLLCLPLLLRGVVGLFAIGGLLLLGAFFLATSLGHTLLPAAIAVAALSVAVISASKLLDRRDAEQRTKSGWRMTGR